MWDWNGDEKIDEWDYMYEDELRRRRQNGTEPDCSGCGRVIIILFVRIKWFYQYCS